MQLGVKEFRECFGGIRKGCREYTIPELFTYTILSSFMPGLGDIKMVGDKERWERGWGENLESFRRIHDEGALVPKYYHPNRILRYGDYYIQPLYGDFEYNFLKVFRAYIFRFLKKYERIYEFGCGTGFNLVELARMYPKKELHGLDWAESSIELIHEINKAFKLDIKSHLFDMFNPSDLEIPDNSAVFTWGALEQLGTNFEPFLQYLLGKKIFVLNIEPIAELYDSNNPMDEYSLEYMEKRGYLKGYLTRLRELEREGGIKIDRVKRIHFGNMNYEGWSFIMWRVK